MLPVVGTAPVLAKSTGSVELTGGAEKATAARPEALEPRAYGEAGRDVERLPREGKRYFFVGDWGRSRASRAGGSSGRVFGTFGGWLLKNLA